jgi:hypothetical protein
MTSRPEDSLEEGPPQKAEIGQHTAITSPSRLFHGNEFQFTYSFRTALDPFRLRARCQNKLSLCIASLKFSLLHNLPHHANHDNEHPSSRLACCCFRCVCEPAWVEEPIMAACLWMGCQLSSDTGNSGMVLRRQSTVDKGADDSPKQPSMSHQQWLVNDEKIHLVCTLTGSVGGF